jgi:hypothetical protein
MSPIPSAASGSRFLDIRIIASSPSSTNPFSILLPPGPLIVAEYLTPDGHIHELYASLADGWNHADLTDATGAPPVAGTSLVGYTWAMYKQVAYFTADGHIHELYASIADGWNHADLTSITGAPSASGTTLVGYGASGFKQVAYLAADGHIHELYATMEDGWNHADLTLVANAPAMSGTFVGYAWGACKQLVYVSPGGDVQELVASPAASWSAADLTALAGAPGVSGLAFSAYKWGAYKQVAYLAADISPACSTVHACDTETSPLASHESPSSTAQTYPAPHHPAQMAESKVPHPGCPSNTARHHPIAPSSSGMLPLTPAEVPFPDTGRSSFAQRTIRQSPFLSAAHVENAAAATRNNNHFSAHQTQSAAQTVLHELNVPLQCPHADLKLARHLPAIRILPVLYLPMNPHHPLQRRPPIPMRP